MTEEGVRIRNAARISAIIGRGINKKFYRTEKLQPKEMSLQQQDEVWNETVQFSASSDGNTVKPNFCAQLSLLVTNEQRNHKKQINSFSDCIIELLVRVHINFLLLQCRLVIWTFRSFLEFFVFD